MVLLLALLLAPLVVYTYKVEAINQEEEKIIWFHVKTANFAEKEPIKIKDLEPGQVKEMICEVFKENCEEAHIIAECESGYNPLAENQADALITGYTSKGVFQINSDDPRLFESFFNIAVAKEMYDKRGWSDPWFNCSKKLSTVSSIGKDIDKV